MEACETMGGANYICTDKTGTLTRNEMNIVRVNEGSKEIDLNNISNENFQGKISDFFTPEFYELFKLSSACNTGTDVYKIYK